MQAAATMVGRRPMLHAVSRSAVLFDVEAENSIAHTIALASARFGQKMTRMEGGKTRSGRAVVKPVDYFTVHDQVRPLVARELTMSAEALEDRRWSSKLPM